MTTERPADQPHPRFTREVGDLSPPGPDRNDDLRSSRFPILPDLF